ncbi:MAG: hypothetical protein WCJ64_20750 [Rhodospirillaceae bacterium]
MADTAIIAGEEQHRKWIIHDGLIFRHGGICQEILGLDPQGAGKGIEQNTRVDGLYQLDKFGTCGTSLTQINDINMINTVLVAIGL